MFQPLLSIIPVLLFNIFLPRQVLLPKQALSLSDAYPQLAPVSPQIKVDQFGYLPSMKKIAIIADPQTGYNSDESLDPGTQYELRKSADGELVLSGPISAWNNGNIHLQSGDKVWWFDFTSCQNEGQYFIYDPDNHLRSNDFEIAEEVYERAMNKALKTFYYQRCGTAKAVPYAEANWTDNACHQASGQDLDCRLVSNPIASTSKDLSGGWHDAGDYNKYVNFTFSTLHDLLSAFEQNPGIWGDATGVPESSNGIPDLLDEIKWELDWLLKMQQTDGSCLMKVSVDSWQANSPPSSDTANRYYGASQSSATRVIAGIFAHASLIYANYNAAFANLLITKAEAAWTWLQSNPGYSYYDNNGFSSSNPEFSEYQQDAASFVAATYLYAKTGNNDYRSYIDDHYDEMHPIQWYYWYPFESTVQDALLFYSNTPGATTSVVNAIQNNCTTAVQSNNPELLQAFTSQTDAYRAYLKDENYVWGSNEVKCHTGTIFSNMLYYLIDTPNAAQYREAAGAYLHFLHGANPTGFTMLSNMASAGAEQSCQEIYHAWFTDGSDFDNATTSLYGPAPGYVTGGCNKYFAPDPAYGGTIEPPQNQPVQKAYKDWNTSWPENSWEVTEPSIYNQAAYIKLLSKFIQKDLDPLQINFYVSPSGDDNNPGSFQKPWATIQKACNEAIAGSTVHIRQGSYQEQLLMNVSGIVDQKIHFRNYMEEEVTLMGDNSLYQTLLEIDGQDHLIIEGIHFTQASGLDAQGLLVHGDATGIEIRNNKFSEIHFSDDPLEPADPTKNSQPLIVYGDDAQTAVSALVIADNEIFNCRTGYSEALAVNGNVDGFLISGNVVHDISNIGIDMIGHEGTCSNPALDQARNGICEDNICYNCNSPYATSAGIYVDGAKNIVIEKNRVFQNQWGIEIGCENVGKSTSGIVLRNNLVYKNSAAGFSIGGYDYPGGSGKVSSTEIYNNTLFENDVNEGYNGEMTLTYTENCIVANNIFCASDQNVLLVLDATPLNLIMDYNLYFSPGGASNMEVAWDGDDYTGFSDYQSNTGQDASSQFADPLFVDANAAEPDLYIWENSPARDAGDPSMNSANLGDFDFLKHPRITNDVVDQGAIESYKIWRDPMSTDWETANNWYPEGIPGTGSDVLIKKGADYYPILDPNTSYQIRSLILENGASLRIGNNATFTVE